MQKEEPFQRLARLMYAKSNRRIEHDHCGAVYHHTAHERPTDQLANKYADDLHVNEDGVAKRLQLRNLVDAIRKHDCNYFGSK